MNYFFTFLLQALLPFSLLLGVYHSKQSSVSAKKIIWLSLFAFIAGIVLRLSLPAGQITNLIVNAVILVLLIIFALCLIFGKGRLPAFWQTVLMLIAGSFWAKRSQHYRSRFYRCHQHGLNPAHKCGHFAFVFCLCLQGWSDLLLKTSGKNTTKIDRTFKRCDEPSLNLLTDSTYWRTLINFNETSSA